MADIENRLAELGLTLPEPVAPVANYVPFVRAGTLLFVSGQVSMGPDGPIRGQLSAADHQEGPLPDNSALKAAQEAAQACGLAMLSQVRAAIGDLDLVERVVKLTAFVNSAPDFTQQPLVANGCSDLMVEVFGERGRHSRSAVGVSSLPLGVAVEIEGVFQVA